LCLLTHRYLNLITRCALSSLRLFSAVSDRLFIDIVLQAMRAQHQVGTELYQVNRCARAFCLQQDIFVLNRSRVLDSKSSVLDTETKFYLIFFFGIRDFVMKNSPVWPNWNELDP